MWLRLYWLYCVYILSPGVHIPLHMPWWQINIIFYALLLLRFFEWSSMEKKSFLRITQIILSTLNFFFISKQNFPGRKKKFFANLSSIDKNFVDDIWDNFEHYKGRCRTRQLSIHSRTNQLLGELQRSRKFGCWWAKLETSH